MITTLVEALTKTNAVSVIPLPPGEPVLGKTFIADGWVYRDFAGKLKPEIYTAFLRLVGSSNYHTLAMSEGLDGSQVVWRRGQFLVSPEGQRRIAVFLGQKTH